MEELFQGACLFKFPVGLLQDGFVLVVQPITFSAADGIHGLCIELLVVDGEIGADRRRYLDADETAAAGGVGQQSF